MTKNTLYSYVFGLLYAGKSDKESSHVVGKISKSGVN